MAKGKNPTNRVESIKHKDTRANIPTEELRDFVAEEKLAPKTLCYPRDPSLDPQLVWKGKDEQDAADLAVPVVPIYIQEKVQPQAIIEDLRAHAKTKDDRIAEDMAAYQTKLFADFNGLPEDFDQRVDFYHHQGHWSTG
jgi:adenine-specific DNA-methyltransferase